MGTGQDTGFVLLHRKAMNSSIWALPGEQFKVAITILCLANWQATKWWDGEREITIQRGDLVASQSKIADRALVSRKTVRSTILRLTRGHFAENVPVEGRRYTWLRILKYDDYQGFIRDMIQGGDGRGTVEGQLRDTSGPVRETQVNKGTREQGNKGSTSPLLPLELTSPSKARKAHEAVAEEVIPHLNEKIGSKYRATTKATLDDFKVLVREKYTADQAKAVVDAKCAEWSGTDRAANLRPSTLFRPANFRRYVADLEGAPTATNRPESGRHIDDWGHS